MGKTTSIPKDMGHAKKARTFLQPLAVALVCLIFVLLVFILGFMDLRNTERTLLSYMEYNGLGLIRDIQQAAEYHFRHPGRMREVIPHPFTAPLFSDEAFSLEESLVMDLAGLAREIDLEWSEGRLGPADLGRVAREETLYVIALLDERGRAVVQTRPLPKALLTAARPVARGEEEVRIHLFGRVWLEGDVRFLALRRQSGKGAIILGLDHEGLGFRTLRASVQRAVEEAGQVPGTVFVLVRDDKNRILARTGRIPGQGEEIGLSGWNPVDRSKGPVAKRLSLGGEGFLEVVAPLRLGGGFRGVAQLGLSTTRVDRVLEKNRFHVFLSMGLISMLALLSMWLLYKNQNRHLARIRDMEIRLEQAERLSALGRLASGVAHEIRNPLNAISMATQRMQRGFTRKGEEDPVQVLDAMREEIRRLNRIVEDFLTFSRTRNLEAKRQDLIKVLAQIVLLVEEDAESRGITLETHWEESPLLLPVDTDKVKQAVLNIIKNALESVSGGGKVSVSAALRDKRWAVIRISDTGSGLTPEAQELIFNLDYTTKEKGLGLGLPLAQEIVRGHGGEIKVKSRPGEGTAFEIFLPLK